MKNINPLHLIFGGAALVVISNFLPWVSVKVSMGSQVLVDESHNGWNKDGAIIFILAAVAVGLSVFKQPGKEKLFSLIAMICSGLALLIGLYDLIKGSSDLSSVNALGGGLSEVKASIGIGLYLTVVGAAVMGFGSFLRWQSIPTPPPGNVPPPTPPPMPPPQA